ncbi:hypothetical protein JKP88DRAFT_230646 [Tribonema minus]|uniref:Uncharacterized protein n=1 Tax=Tribonema minus TaxID=303371 RepID=A0A835ZCS2_9STRA|nr:hypothetical protein JKP88DRAFT_230646 [Tribonema minus]
MSAAESIDAAMATEQQQHPECSFSRSMSKSCQSINGDMRCENLQKLLRRCPGDRNATIVFSKSDVTEGAEAGDFGSQLPSLSQFSSLPRWGSNRRSQPQAEPSPFMKEVDDAMGAIGSFLPFAGAVLGSFDNMLRELSDLTAAADAPAAADVPGGAPPAARGPVWRHGGGRGDGGGRASQVPPHRMPPGPFGSQPGPSEQGTWGDVDEV